MTEYLSHLQSVLIPDSERQYQRAISQSYQNTKKLLESSTSLYTKQRLNQILRAIEEELTSINRAFGVSLSKELIDITYMDNKAVAEETSYIAQNAIVTAPMMYAIPKKQVQHLISNLAKDNLVFSYRKTDGTVSKSSISTKNLFSSPSDQAIKKVNSIITAGVTVGDSPEKIARDIRREYTTVQKRNARTTTRTIIAQASQDAHTEFYDEYSDDIARWKFVATLDTKTSSICRSLDGRTWVEKPKSYYFPQLHPNCRSKMIGIPDGYPPQDRPINLMTPQDKKKARKLRGDDREKFLKSKIFTIEGNLTYKEAVSMYPDLDNKAFIDTDVYFRKLGF